MIDLVYKTLLTILNKENQGYVTPTEFNLLSNNVQSEIFREYFEDVNRDKNRDNRGLSNKGYSNIEKNERYRIQRFSASDELSETGGLFELPSDLYFIEDDGVTTLLEGNTGTVIEETERRAIGYLNKSEAAPTSIYPIYEALSDNKIQVYPTSIDKIAIRYLRKPKKPNWTYQVITNFDGSSKELYDPTDPSFQDFELHESEFSNIVLRMLTYFSINLREAEVMQIAELLKDKINVKEEQ